MTPDQVQAYGTCFKQAHKAGHLHKAALAAFKEVEPGLDMETLDRHLQIPAHLASSVGAGSSNDPGGAGAAVQPGGKEPSTKGSPDGVAQ